MIDVTSIREGLPSRVWLLRGLVLAVILLLVAPGVIDAMSPAPTSFQRGVIEQEPNGSTVIGIQGWHFNGTGNSKKPARVVSVTPDGSIGWLLDPAGSTHWYYDVDPLSNGNLLITSTIPQKTVVFEYNPETDERVWEEQFDFADTHDVDVINGDELLIADKEYHRVLIYNRTSQAFVWEWNVSNHFPTGLDKGMNKTKDWTHLNDVDKVGPGQFLVSPRNFDQVILINRSSKEIEWHLGSDNNYDILNEQHNPDLIWNENGQPAVLVADSENDRVVEYQRLENGSWKRTWVLSGALTWPRDADRLPNGNTLIVDSINHRVIEVTPKGEIVWEYYATWAPYDAERIGTGDGSNGPTMTSIGTTGSYTVGDGAGYNPSSTSAYSVGDWIISTGNRTPLAETTAELGKDWAHLNQWVRPIWLTDWHFLYLILATFIGLAWAGGEVVFHRQKLLAVVRRLISATRARMSPKSK